MLLKPKAVPYRVLRAGKASGFKITSFTHDQRGYIVFVHSTLIKCLNNWEEIFLAFFTQNYWELKEVSKPLNL